jgi:glycosyltransferase involved in cell wall biosynthesis
MKILMVSKSAVVAAHHDKLRELVRRGVQLTLIVPPRYGNQALEVCRSDSYDIRVLPCWFTPYNHFHFYPARAGTIDADLVHLEEEPWSLVTHQFMRQCVKAKKPVVFISWQNLYKKYPPPFNFFERYTFSHAQAAIAGSREVLEIMRAKGFKKRAIIATYGVNPEVFVRRDVASLRGILGLGDAFVIGFAGRIVFDKGIADLIRAFALLPSPCVLLLIGDGSFRLEAERLAISLGVNSRIRWVPQVASLEMADYLNLMDVLVLPSRTTSVWKEQFGRVLIEAMACETPPVGSNSGEIPSVIADAGLVFPEGDVEALAERLRLLLQNPQLRISLGKKGRERVLETFTNRRLAEKTVELYREVLAEYSARVEDQLAVLRR